MPAAKPKEVSYRVKIINPHLKKDAIIRDLRKFNGGFKTIIDLKVRLMDEFGDQIPPSTTFGVGYFAGRVSAKYWIYTEEDLQMMYFNCLTDDIMLWCDGRSDTIETPKSKRRKTSDNIITKREEKEMKVEELADELKELNEDRLGLTEIQYRLWARMISNGIHSSKDTPPQVPMITGVTPKRKKRVDEERKTLHDSTAAAVVKAVNSGSN